MIPISTGFTSGLILTNKFSYEVIMNKYEKVLKRSGERSTNKFFVLTNYTKNYRQVDVIEKKNMNLYPFFFQIGRRKKIKTCWK